MTHVREGAPVAKANKPVHDRRRMNDDLDRVAPFGVLCDESLTVTRMGPSWRRLGDVFVGREWAGEPAASNLFADGRLVLRVRPTYAYGALPR